jgi:hypothetical protein
MLALMMTYYANVTRRDFETDLENKDYAILLRNPHGEIAGFSTLKSFPYTQGGRRIRVAFSGDTIIDRRHWGSICLPLAFGQLMNRLRLQHDEDELYWFLISKGIRTYRFLPVFFKHFYPACGEQNDLGLKPLLDRLGRDLFNESYDATSGTIVAKSDGQYLENEYSGDTHAGRDVPHIDFFYRKNPGYARGDELACLLRFEESNLSPFIRKRLAKAEAESMSPLCL